MGVARPRGGGRGGRAWWVLAGETGRRDLESEIGNEPREDTVPYIYCIEEKKQRRKEVSILQITQEMGPRKQPPRPRVPTSRKG